MTYILCKHKKTGSERIFTEPIFRANEHQYKFISYTDNPNAKKKEAPAPALRTEAKEVKKEVVAKEPTTDVVNSVLSDLQAQYKALTGKDANKKWGVPKLTEAIKALETPTA